MNDIQLSPWEQQVADQNRRTRYLIDQLTGRPDRPGFESLLGPDGLIQSQYRATDMYDTGALEGLRAEAGRAPGEQSAWRMAQQNKLMQDAGNVQSQAQTQNQINQNQMAMRGGLRGGSAERMGNQSTIQGLLAAQNILGQGTQLDIQDEANRLNALTTANQANLGAAQQQQGIEQLNIQNSLNDVFQRRYRDMMDYKEDMGAWGAQQTAAATPSGGGKK